MADRNPIVEPTDEEVAAFKETWEWRDRIGGQEGHRTRTGLRRVLSMHDAAKPVPPSFTVIRERGEYIARILDRTVAAAFTADDPDEIRLLGQARIAIADRMEADAREHARLEHVEAVQRGAADLLGSDLPIGINAPGFEVTDMAEALVARGWAPPGTTS